MKSSQETIKKKKTETTRVVILGSGYAGIHAACRLLKKSTAKDNLEIVLLSETDHLLYVTMIYEVAAGNLAPSSVRQSVRTTLSGDKVRFIQGRVQSVDFDDQVINYQPKDAITTDTGSETEVLAELSYDYLISAIGSKTTFADTPGAAEYTHTLKTLADAKQIKNRLIDNFETAARTTDINKQAELLSFVIVGGGPTGVTLAAKIADLLNDEMTEAFPDLAALAQVTILEGGDRLLSNLDSWFSRRAQSALEEKGCVQVRLNHYVESVHPDGVTVDDTIIPSRCVIWVAGVRAREFDILANQAVSVDERSRRIHVTNRLQLANYPNVFVAGDQSWVESEGGPYPMRAQFAVRQGRQAAENVLCLHRGIDLQAFSWQDKGLVVSVGKGRTYAEVAGIHFSGLPASIAYKLIYLLSTIGIRAKLRAMLEWGMNIFLPRDVSEL